MRAGQSAQAADRVTIHPTEPPGLADATPLVEVLQDRIRSSRAAVASRTGVPFRSKRALQAAHRSTAGLVATIAAGDSEVSGAPLTMFGAIGIQATEPRQVVHDAATPVRSSSSPSVTCFPSYNRCGRYLATLVGHEATPDMAIIFTLRPLSQTNSSPRTSTGSGGLGREPRREAASPEPRIKHARGAHHGLDGWFLRPL